MARLIDAEKLWLTTEYVDGKEHKYYEQFEVDDAPAIDAEPVIRCKDCKWFGIHTGWKGNKFSVCRNVTCGMAYIKAYDYCSRAESKDGGGEKWKTII